MLLDIQPNANTFNSFRSLLGIDGELWEPTHLNSSQHHHHLVTAQTNSKPPPQILSWRGGGGVHM